jgi:glutathione S-transferase
MQLYYAEVMNPRKACAVARYLDSPVEFVRVDLAKGEHKRPDFLAKNPNGKVPVLVDGDTSLWESNAIMCYLADKAGSDLWPRDERQIEVLRWLNWEATEFTPQVGTFYFEYIIKPMFGLGAPDPAEIQRATVPFKKKAKVLDDHLRGRNYLVGDALTVADFAVAVTLPWAEPARIPLEEFPEVRRWHAGLSRLPAWRQPFPEMAAAA